jgi:hypothetical protein
LLLENGTVSFDGGVQEAIKKYLSSSVVEKSAEIDFVNRTDRKGNGQIKISKIQLFNKDQLTNRFVIGDDLKIRVFLNSIEATRNVKMALHFYRFDETMISNIENIDADFVFEPFTGEKCFEIIFPKLHFYPDTYKVGITIATSDWGYNYDRIVPCFEFVIQEGSKEVKRRLTLNGGFIYLVPSWKSL